MEAPLKSEVVCSSFMLFSLAFGGTICQVINAECWMVLHLLCFFPLFCMQPILSSLAGYLLIGWWNGVNNLMWCILLIFYPFRPAFGGVICQVINVECSMVLYLLCFLGLFSCKYLAFQFTFPPADTCTFMFCIWGFAFVVFLVSLVAYACFLVELFVFWRWCIICFASDWFCYQLYLIVCNIYLCFSTYAAISGAGCSLVLYLRCFFALFFMQVYSFQYMRLCVLHMRFCFCCLAAKFGSMCIWGFIFMGKC